MIRNNDFWLALGVFGLSAGAAALTLDVPGQGTGAGPGPSFVPWLMIGGMALFSVLLLWRSQWRGETYSAAIAPRALAKMGGFLLMMVAYAVAYEPVGYIISSLVFFVVGLLVLGERRPLRLLLIPPGVVLTVYLVFTEVMQVYMP